MFLRGENVNGLELYLKENPNKTMTTGQTILGKWYVRPASWAGMWKDFKLVSGNCLACFDTSEELENKLDELKYFKGVID